MGVSEALFWVGGGGWGIILDGWRWVGHYFGWVGVGTLFDNALKLRYKKILNNIILQKLSLSTEY